VQKVSLLSTLPKLFPEKGVIEEAKMKKSLGIVLVLGLMILAIAGATAYNIKGHHNQRNAAQPDIIQGLANQTPTIYSDAENALPSTAGKFLIWTNDGEHIMWGKYGGGYFVGTDNNGKQAWGAYNKTRFAGVRDGVSFTGKVSHGQWKAENLFGLNSTQGSIKLFGQIEKQGSKRIGLNWMHNKSGSETANDNTENESDSD
jgi:hypothetical protein